MDRDFMDARIICKGDVQGVGFRARTRSAARKYGFCGLVRNLPDGSVEIFLCGDGNSLGAFLNELREPFSFAGLKGGKADNIEVFRKGEQDYKPAWKEFNGFEIDYG